MQVILSVKVTIRVVAGFTCLNHPEFDPLGVVDLVSTLEASMVGMYVAFRL
jgi:hypothetical protein